MKTRKEMRLQRKLAIRYKVRGTSRRPRLAVFRSNTRLAVQLIDDEQSVTILSRSVRSTHINAARELAKEVVKAMQSHTISSVVFDRSGYRYHGAVKALAEAIREGGIIL